MLRVLVFTPQLLFLPYGACGAVGGVCSKLHILAYTSKYYVMVECLAMGGRDTFPRSCNTWWVFYAADYLACKLLSGLERDVIIAV